MLTSSQPGGVQRAGLARGELEVLAIPSGEDELGPLSARSSGGFELAPTDPGLLGTCIMVSTATSVSDPIVITNNTIFGGVGINASGKTPVYIENNEITSVDDGLVLGGNADFHALVQGNNFRSYRGAGVVIIGDGVRVGTIDLGGGSLSSRGGNDFRAFTTAATATAAAIVIQAASETDV
jgi:hypothetical protein